MPQAVSIPILEEDKIFQARVVYRRKEAASGKVSLFDGGPSEARRDLTGSTTA